MKMLYKFVFVALLAATLVLVSCEDSATTVNFPTIAAPKVTATPIQDGVKLEWDADKDANSYVIYRKEDGGQDVLLRGDPSTDPVSGKFYYRDLQSAASNSVKPSAKYKYTVKAYADSNFKESASKTVDVTTNAFHPRGYELAPPSAVAIELLPDSDQIKVTVTPGADADVARGYWVQLQRDGTSLSGGGGVWINYLETTNVYTWASSAQRSGTYRALVKTESVNYNESTYEETFYTASKYVADEKDFESLFGDNFSDPSISYNSVVVGTGTNITTAQNLSVSVSNLQGFKPGVTYTIERATANKLGYAAGAWEPVSLMTRKSDGTYESASLTTDPLGNLGQTSFYDRTLPVTGGEFLYRVKAVKGAVTQYKPKDGRRYAIDPNDLVADYISLSVGARDATTANVVKFAVTPSIEYKNILAEGGKLVIYWLKSENYNSYQIGKYDNTIEFTKANLESATPGTISVPSPATETGTYYVYAQAYVEFADGTKEVLDYYIWNGAGFSSSPDYSSTVRLDY